MIDAILLSVALLGSELPTPVSDRAPKLNPERLCRARSIEDKLMQLPESQSVEDCLRDETAARQRLGTIWETTSVTIRNRCQAEIIALGTRSYLDLLACIELAEDTRPVPALKKGKDRNTN